MSSTKNKILFFLILPVILSILNYNTIFNIFSSSFITTNIGSILNYQTALAIPNIQANNTFPPSPLTDLETQEQQETITSGDVKATNDSSRFLEYKNTDLGIRIQYPSDWTKIENITYGQVKFISPKKDFLDPFLETFLITLSNSQGMTIDQYFRFNIDPLKNRVPEFKIIESSSTTLAGNPAQKIVYTGKPNPPSQSDVTVMLIATIKNNIKYVVNYSAEQGKGYFDYLPIIQKMIDSLEISQPTSAS